MAKPGKNKNKNVPGPFDRPYLTNRQIREEAIRRAASSVVPLAQIEKDTERERVGARAITESFADMLARQSAQNLAAEQAIQAASGGAGSALTTGAITGATQAAAGVPLFAAGEGVRMQRDVEARGSEARMARNEAFRKNRALFEQQIRDEETSKQASRIEAQAAEKAYGFKLADAKRQQANEDRNYALAVRRENRLANADTGNISDLIPTLNDIAKEASVSKGASNRWTGEISYVDADGKRQKVSLPSEGIVVPYDPKTASNKTKMDFWRKVLQDVGGVSPEDMMDPNNIGRSINRMDAKTNPVSVARDLFDYITALGYTRQEAYAAILKTVWGGANARAVSAALGG